MEKLPFIKCQRTFTHLFFFFYVSHNAGFIFQEGTVHVPSALQPYLGLEVIEKPKQAPLKYIGPNQHSRPARPAPKPR